ncbi:MAG: DUF5615 family PIN-like protein [Acidobacteria bacterium]|nr:DUF5615 family PIN-like protein [Acidobacteriota bacterium]
MKLVADESVDRPIVDRLRAAGHHVYFVAESCPGVPDPEVLGEANKRRAVLITADTDFGELTFRLGWSSTGILLLRLAGMPPREKAEVVASVIQLHSSDLPGSFSVLTPRTFRIRRVPRAE